MKYYFAPMEGITTHVFRAVHSRRFPGADRYYTPFFSPTSDHLFTPRELRELTPERRCAAPVVPQILSKCAADIVWAAEGLQDMGYTVFNLNLGCPSATVTAKGKGAGLLQKPDAPVSEQAMDDCLRIVREERAKRNTVDAASLLRMQEELRRKKGYGGT